MSEAPEEIVVSVDYENFNGTRLRMGCVTVGTDGVPMPFDPTHYIRRDIHRALLKAEREKALREAAEVCERIRTQKINGPMPERACFDYEQSIHALISEVATKEPSSNP